MNVMTQPYLYVFEMTSVHSQSAICNNNQLHGPADATKLLQLCHYLRQKNAPAGFPTSKHILEIGGFGMNHLNWSRL